MCFFSFYKKGSHFQFPHFFCENKSYSMACFLEAVFTNTNTRNLFLQGKDDAATRNKKVLTTFERNSCYGKSIFKINFWKCFHAYYFSPQMLCLPTKSFLCVFEILRTKFSMFYIFQRILQDVYVKSYLKRLYLPITWQEKQNQVENEHEVSTKAFA